MPARKLWKRAGWALLGLFTLGVVLVVVLLAVAWKPMGQTATGERLQRMTRSPHWAEDRFVDVMPRVEPDIWKILPMWMEAPLPYRRPQVPLPILRRKKQEFSEPPPSGLRITWLGHSTLIVEIDGFSILIDPVWGDYVAPLPISAARRFAPPPLPFSELPDVDAVLISHDHYDHLDYPTVLSLAQRNVPFYVPLGVGAHLSYWGIAKERIIESDWWDERSLGELKLVCGPARHFSGRSLSDRDTTLWAGWAIIGPIHRVYYTGDTAMFPGFSEMGERYGPFDATLVESGAYNAMWADVHLGPEQAVRAHQMLRGKVMIPVHWGMFDLALHGWTEPVERVLLAAEKAAVVVRTPHPGESIEPTVPGASSRWWPKRPFDTADVAPIVSSGL
jgi:L-ascorbate metabolism protein UlaG (beta-lactamase superfamily)